MKCQRMRRLLLSIGVCIGGVGKGPDLRQEIQFEELCMELNY
jgi:hypothetical protein